MAEARLKRAMGLFEATVYGVGIIVGAGIYALIGKVCGLAGNAVWLSFAISSVLALFTGLSYAELSSLFPKDAAEYEYVKKSTKNRFLSLLQAWFVIASFTIAASVVALGFGNYLSALLFGNQWNYAIDLSIIVLNPPVILAILAIALFTYINYKGIELSTDINIPSTFLEVGGLVFITLGVAWLVLNGQVQPINYMQMPNGMTGVLSGAILAFFAYIGFGSIAKMGEEMKNPKVNMPLAIILSIIITTILYILVAGASVTAVGWQELYNSPEPISLVANAIHPFTRVILSIIALFSTGNTILLILITLSRMVYGIASEGELPKVLAKINPKTQTPVYSVFLAGGIAALLTLFKNIETVAAVTNLWIFIVYAFVNLSVILLRYYSPKEKRMFRIPGSIGWVPIIPALGFIVSILMGGYVFFMGGFSIYRPEVWLTGLLLLGVIGFYFEREAKTE